jgi:hypothetical protein
MSVMRGDFIITFTRFHVYGEINTSDTHWSHNAGYICGIVPVMPCDIHRRRSNRLCEKEFPLSSVKTRVLVHYFFANNPLKTMSICFI